MAENGFFRVSFRGFNKQDVLQYIDEIQTASAQKLAQVEEMRLEAQKAASVSAAAANEAIARAGELEQEAASLRTQVEQLTALAQVYKRELVQLRGQVPAEEAQMPVADTGELEEANTRVAELEEQCALLKEQNARYAQLVGDVSRVIVETRVVGSSYLDAAHQKSTDCLKQLETFLSDLQSQASKAMETADSHRQNGDSYLQILLSDLKELTGELSGESR